ncbi:tetratricopeptide repeat protein [Rhizobium sp. J15]|uniref:tetratricopeptide repeat protein n=1 Tax=Rhizobium sp. J15 TaxID=2035450 RepID=UPI001596B8EC|nr:tetratricopeptide repeat protein [Rhizobium sp. J15]
MRRLIYIFVFFLSIWSGARAADTAQAAYDQRDYATAFALWQPQAAAGDPQAQTALGSLFASGRGVTKDDDQAVAWFRKAAEQDFPPGQFALGGMYLQGRGVPANAGQAAFWLQKAADKDVTLAQLYLSEMYEAGTGVPKDAEKAKYWKDKADIGLKALLPASVLKQLR